MVDNNVSHATSSSRVGNLTKVYVTFVGSNYIYYKYLIPALFIIGVTGNLFAFTSIVAQRLFRKSPMFVFFMFMAGLDGLKVGIEAGQIVVEDFIYKAPWSLDDEYAIHNYLGVIARYIGDGAMVSSVYILICANAYKLYALIKPMRVKASDRIYAFWSCFIAIAIVFSLSTYRLITFKRREYHLGGNFYTMYVGPTEDYQFLVIHVFYPLIMCLYSIIPGFILIFLSIGILVSFWTSYRKYLKMTQTSDTTDRSSYKTAKASILALLPVSLFHILCTFPGLILIIIIDVATFGYLILFMFILNHSTNVYLQMACSKFYRDAILGRQTK